MTREDKELLLKDLSARVPYGVKVSLDNGKDDWWLLTGFYQSNNCGSMCILLPRFYSKNNYPPTHNVSLETVMLYLRPMSSMTEEEKQYLNEKYGVVDIDEDVIDFGRFPYEHATMSMKNFASLFDWLFKHHFDYRGLIDKGLALEAPSGMYKTELL